MDGIFWTKWSFKRTSPLPVLDCICEADDVKAEHCILETAIVYIDLAEKFKGIAIQGNTPQTKSNIILYFSLMFPSEKEFNEFNQAIQNK